MDAENLFFSSNSGQINPAQIVREIIDFINSDKERQYKITIGTDSQQTGRTQADFVTAIVIHRIGNGGRYFWRRQVISNLHSLRDRIWQEVLLSLDIAKELVSLVKEQNLPSLDFEVHIDVGDNGNTRTMIQELVGVVRANNFVPSIKPFSYAASTVADRHTK